MNLPSLILQQAEEHNVVLYLKGTQLAYISEEGKFPAALKELVRENKDSILAYLKQQAQSKAYDPTLITVADERNLLPLSFAQQGLWFVDKLEGGSSQYNIPGVFRLRGELNSTALKAALDSIIERHEVLRTVFVAPGGIPYQQIMPAKGIELPVIELEGIDSQKQQMIVRQLVNKETNQVFDLSNDLMLRVKLLRLSPVEHILLFTMHHIVSDGWSQAVLVREFVTLYSCYCRNQFNPLPPLEIQYGDYASWQRGYYTDDVLAGQLVFWRQMLDGAPERHSLPLDFLRPRQQRFAGQTYDWMIELPLLERLKTLAKAHDVTLFMILYTIYSIVIGRWSQKQDVVIGCPIAGRTHPQTAPLIGYFINSLVCRTKWSAEQTFASLLRQNRHNTLAAFDHQNIPLETLVNKLNIPRELSHSPLFQLMFTLQNNEKSELQLPGLHVDVLGGDNNIIKYDMELEASEHENGLQFHWNYSVNLFNEQTVAAMAAALDLIIEQVVDNPEITVEQLRISPQIVTQSTPESVCIALNSLLQQNMVKHGNALAITCQSAQISYLELNSRANQLARHLLAKGLAIGQMVAVCMPNTIERYVTLLAVLKAGAHYCFYEEQHVGLLLSDTRHQFVVSCKSLATVLPVGAIFADEEQLYAAYSCENLPEQLVSIHGESAALADYQRSEQRLSHKTLCTQIISQQRYMMLTTDSTVIQLPGSCYFAATDWLAALLAGSRLMLVDNFSCTEDCLVRQAVTHLTLTPALLGMLPYRPDYSLKYIMVAGVEDCQHVLWQWARHYRVRRVLNIGVQCYLCLADVVAGQHTNLGKMTPHGDVKIVHQRGLSVPAGSIGELFSGNGLIDGCAIKVRQLHDQTVALVSDERRDLGPDQHIVESFISAFPGVISVAVVSGIAYVRFDAGCGDIQLKLEELHLRLKQELPSYLLPEHCADVEQMPLTVSAEIDRRCLSLQLAYWQNLLKNCPEVIYKNIQLPSRKSRERQEFLLNDEAAAALAELVILHNTEPDLVLSAVFTLVLAIHNETLVIAHTVSGLKTEDANSQCSSVFMINQLDENCTCMSLVGSLITNLRHARSYRFLGRKWLTDIYNQFHPAQMPDLFEHQICFGGSHATKNGALELRLSNADPLEISGHWDYASGVFDKTAISRINNNFNFLLLMLLLDTMSFSSMKEKINEKIRSKARSAKSVFNPTFNKNRV